MLTGNLNIILLQIKKKWKNNDLYFMMLLDMFLIKEKPLAFRNKRILIICFSLALFLFSELVLNAVFSYTFYDDDIECECCDLCQNIHADNININKKDEDEVEEIEDDSFLYSLFKKEKQFCIARNCNLNLESILRTYPQTFNIIIFDGKSKQKNNIGLCVGNENTLEILRTVVLVI